MDPCSPLDLLLIEDNPGDARLIREMLVDAGASAWRVEHVDRLAPGLERLKGGRYDVVLLDLSLPDTHGFETVGTVLALVPTVPIIVLTGLDDETVAVRAVQAGAQDYLVKSDVSGSLLVRSIRYAIERKRAELERIELLASEQAARAQAEAERARFRTILDAAPGGVIYVEAATGRITANAEAARLFARLRSADANVAQYGSEIAYPDGRRLERDELPSSRALRGERVAGEEYCIVQEDGRQLPVVVSATPVQGPDGSISGAVATFHDISAIKELARLREEWTSVIAHDLRQPIGVITTLASALRERWESEATDSGELRAIAHIGTAAEHLKKMTNDLLDVSLLDASSLRLELRLLDLVLLVREVIDRAAEWVNGRDVQFAAPEQPLPIHADPGRIEQILGNLLSNAVKYSTPDTPIQVELAADTHDALLAVVNEGIGIAPSELPQLFTRFHRTQAVRDRRISGLGLGLYLTKGLVEAHGGRIWAESEPGRTTAFRIRLPLARFPTDVGASTVSGRPIA